MKITLYSLTDLKQPSWEIVINLPRGWTTSIFREEYHIIRYWAWCLDLKESHFPAKYSMEQCNLISTNWSMFHSKRYYQSRYKYQEVFFSKSTHKIISTTFQDYEIMKFSRICNFADIWFQNWKFFFHLFAFFEYDYQAVNSEQNIRKIEKLIRRYKGELLLLTPNKKEIPVK